MSKYLLDVRNLSTSFYTHFGEVQALRNISFSIKKGEIFGIVGESGCGKSVSMLSVMRLLQHPGKIKDGKIFFKNEDLTAKSKKEMKQLRGNDISMIFQDPLTSLNPVFTVGNQLIEAIVKHTKLNRIQAKKKAVEMLRLVEIPSPEKRINQYPYELSGGMRQRVMIAMALSCDPDLLIADEPTTALDVTIQAQILELMGSLKDRLDTAIIIITHDLGVVAGFCENIMIMYGGLIVEQGVTRDIFYSPKHPYTIGLLGAVPSPDMNKDETRLTTIPGSPPDLLFPPSGCPFAERCPQAMRVCAERLPYFKTISDTHKVMCWLFADEYLERIEMQDQSC
jgi:oligopeptide transport system ATP-binding protein